jgi:hypothetical protein
MHVQFQFLFQQLCPSLSVTTAALHQSQQPAILLACKSCSSAATLYRKPSFQQCLLLLLLHPQVADFTFAASEFTSEYVTKIGQINSTRPHTLTLDCSKPKFSSILSGSKLEQPAKIVWASRFSFETYLLVFRLHTYKDLVDNFFISESSRLAFTGEFNSSSNCTGCSAAVPLSEPAAAAAAKWFRCNWPLDVPIHHYGTPCGMGDTVAAAVGLHCSRHSRVTLQQPQPGLHRRVRSRVTLPSLQPGLHSVTVCRVRSHCSSRSWVTLHP